MIYDVWGPTYELCELLESTSEPNRVHVSKSTREQLPKGTSVGLHFVVEDAKTMLFREEEIQTFFVNAYVSALVDDVENTVAVVADAQDGVGGAVVLGSTPNLTADGAIVLDYDDGVGKGSARSGGRASIVSEQAVEAILENALACSGTSINLTAASPEPVHLLRPQKPGRPSGEGSGAEEENDDEVRDTFAEMAGSPSREKLRMTPVSAVGASMEKQLAVAALRMAKEPTEATGDYAASERRGGLSSIAGTVQDALYLLIYGKRKSHKRSGRVAPASRRGKAPGAKQVGTAGRRGTHGDETRPSHPAPPPPESANGSGRGHGVDTGGGFESSRSASSTRLSGDAQAGSHPAPNAGTSAETGSNGPRRSDARPRASRQSVSGVLADTMSAIRKPSPLAQRKGDEDLQWYRLQFEAAQERLYLSSMLVVRVSHGSAALALQSVICVTLALVTEFLYDISTKYSVRGGGR